MSETINHRQPEASNEWEALLNSSDLSKKIIPSLSDDAKKELDSKLTEIDKDEKNDYKNKNNRYDHKHTREGYAKLRQSVVKDAVNQDLSNLDEHALSELNAKLLQVNEDEAKDYTNEYAISHNHTKAEYDQFRADLIKEAILEAKQKAAIVEGDKDKQLDIDKDKQSGNIKGKLTDKEKQELLAKEEKALLLKLRKLEDEYRKRMAEIDKELGPLTGINANFTHDKKELAHDFAEQELNADNAKSNFIKRIWKGNLFKKYYEKKYEREIMEGERNVNVNGERMSLDQVIERRSDSAIQRFILSTCDEYGENMVHRKAGEYRTEADKETTAAVSGVIKKFATEWAKNNADTAALRDNKDIKREFDNSIREELAKLHDSIDPSNQTELNNYYEVALSAKERAEIAFNAGAAAAHEVAMERVMEGFKLYNAEVRNNVRSEAHRDKCDKIINRLESTALGSIMPPEVIAAAVGTALAFTRTGARVVTGVAGGIGLSGVSAGLRERNRVTEDRTRMMRDQAMGLEYRSGNRRRARYEARIGDTVYRTLSANQLTNNIEWAINTGNNNTILRAIAEARVRIDFSDANRKDLISYSSADKLGDERTKLDIAVIRAERALSNYDRRKLETMKDVIERRINNDIKENDRDFRRLRAAQAIKQAGKSIVIGSAFYFGSQEVMAALDPNKIGLFEKANIIHTQNNDETATETVLAGLAGPRVRTEVNYSAIKHISGDNKAAIDRYEQNDFKKVEVRPAYTSTKTDLVEVSPAKSAHALKVNTSFADNGTKVADGNELRLSLENGRYISKLHGNSTLGNQTFNYDQLANAGQIKGHLNIGGGTFEIRSVVDPATGQITWPIDANGSFTTTTGETIKAFGANGEKLFKSFRVVADNGRDADGVIQAVSLAADSGNDSFNGFIQQLVEIPVHHPAIYNFIKRTETEYPRGISLGGIVAPIASRTGLGAAEQTSEASPAPTPASASTSTSFNEVISSP